MGLLSTTRRRRWRAENVEAPDPARQLNRKLWILHVVVLAAFTALTIQLARLQLVQGGDFQQRAELNQLRIEPVIPSRGLIYDRTGRPVVENIPGFSAAVVAADIPPDRTLEIAGAVEKLLGVPALETTLKIQAARNSKDPFTPVIVKDGLDQQAAFHAREQLPFLPGVQIVVQPVRHYTAGDVLAQVLGYTGRVDEEDYAQLQSKGYVASDRIGKAGVEAAYETYLRGGVGRKEIEKDATGRELLTLGEDPSRPGNDLVLSLDLDLQRKTTELTQVAAHGGEAAAIVMDVHTGEVLALVSLPLYDNNALSGKIDEAKLEDYLADPKKPLVNHALSEQYAPGSIFKQITGSAALQEGVATSSTTLVSNGFINVPNQYDPSIIYRFNDWRINGVMDFYSGVAYSSDVYFYYLAGGYHAYGESFDGLGVVRLARYARQFGLGRKTGIDIAGEADGVIPDPDWKKATFGDDWFLGDTYNMGIGQGFVATTPIQMLRVVAAVANGGTLLTPRVVREVRDAQGHVVVAAGPKIEGNVGVSPENLAIVREAMRQAVSRGSASLGAVPGVEVGGKTGTAEFGPQLPNGQYETHAWFSGFAPAADPQVAVTVFLERGVGANDAAPLASKILDYYFHRPQQQAAGGDSAAPGGVTP